MVDIVMYTNVSENVQPGTIVTFIDVGNILFKRLFISSELCYISLYLLSKQFSKYVGIILTYYSI
jgi:hypothetical protein